MAELAGFKRCNVRLPAAFPPGFVHGQRVRRPISGCEGRITATTRGRIMYRMGDDGWSAPHYELEPTEHSVVPS
jgi:hypothetical protein